MGYYLLFIIEATFITINIGLLKRDIMSPATITSLGIFVATFFSFIESNIWNTEINIYTIIVIFCGLFIATVSEQIIKKRIKFCKVGQFNTRQKYDDFCLNKRAYCIFFMVAFIAFFLYILDAYRVGITNGGSELNAFAYMKEAYMRSSGNLMNPIIRQGFKLVMTMSYIS